MQVNVNIIMLMLGCACPMTIAMAINNLVSAISLLCHRENVQSSGTLMIDKRAVIRLRLFIISTRRKF